MAATMQEATTGKLYDLWAKFYDATFGRLVHRRHIRAIELLRPDAGDRVLDLGVGTGMTLPEYRRDIEIVGIDLSPGMLGKAADKVAADRLDHVTLVLGDAMAPPLAEQSFDCIIVTHVISVVSDPAALLDWARRLCKPGGRIIILNHFQSDFAIVRWFERTLNPLFVKIGWRSDLDLGELLADSPLVLDYQCKLSAYDLWQIVVLHREDAAPDERSRPRGGSRAGQLSAATDGL